MCDIAVSWMQLLAGTSFSVFANVKIDLPHLSPMKWLPAIWQFLHDHDLWLELEDPFIPKLQREGDGFLMDIVLQQKYTPTEIQRINACRLFKGVTLISDISTIAGDSIKEDMLTSEVAKTKPKGLMPYQSCPNKGSWNLWKKFLSKLCTSGTKFSQHLGCWLVTGSAMS